MCSADEYFKTAEFCSMCGPKYRPMHNFREVDWKRLETVATGSEVFKPISDSTDPQASHH
jgi:hypothetical protein